MSHLLNDRLHEIFPGAPPDFQIKSQGKDLTVVDITAVTDYMFSGTDQEEWQTFRSEEGPTDFPNIAPPWLITWYEFHVRRGQAVLSRARGNGIVPQDRRCAAMEYGLPVKDELQAHLVGQGAYLKLMGMLGVSDADIERAIDRIAALTLQGSAKWACFGTIYEECLGVFDRLMVYAYLVEPNGEMMPRSQVMFAGSTRFDLSGMEKRIGELMTPFLFAKTFLHCKNVIIQDNPISVALQKARQRRGRPPLIQYKTLVVEPIKAILRQQGNAENTGIKMALHICRGHFKDFSEGRGLFGKLHGMFWWPQHIRGKAECGEVRKDYRIGTPVRHEEVTA